MDVSVLSVFLLIVKIGGEEVSPRTHFFNIYDCTAIAHEIRFSYTGNPPLQAYCIPGVVEAPKDN